ncbi:hypothetical protein ACFV8T_33370 [Streptomyces sp. NPDC059832]|uniref:hypothetical protein n=1 Tax=Streptomyces sp. NPDC059832 TaxID=3346966 RepID=UPI003664A352
MRHHAACADAQQFAQTTPTGWVRRLSIAGTPAQAHEAIKARDAGSSAASAAASARRGSPHCGRGS